MNSRRNPRTLPGWDAPAWQTQLIRHGTRDASGPSETVLRNALIGRTLLDAHLFADRRHLCLCDEEMPNICLEVRSATGRDEVVWIEMVDLVPGLIEQVCWYRHPAWDAPVSSGFASAPLSGRPTIRLAQRGRVSYAGLVITTSNGDGVIDYRGQSVMEGVTVRPALHCLVGNRAAGVLSGVQNHD